AVTDLDGKRVDYATRSGHPAEFPRHLGGISGGSVWKIGDRRIPVHEWHRARPRIAAIQTGAFPEKRVLKATRCPALTMLLYNAFPVVRPSLNMWRLE